MYTKETKELLAIFCRKHGYMKGPVYYRVPDYDKGIKALIDRYYAEVMS